MRAAGVMTGLMVLGSFVIPGTYSSNGAPGRGIWGSPTQELEEYAELGAGTATLTGRVFDEGGRGVGGAIVSLAGSGFWPARSAESGPDGRFVWLDVPAGIYELRVSKGELVAPPLEGLILDAGAQRMFGMRLARGWTVVGRVVDAGTGNGVVGAEVTVATGALGLHTRRVFTTGQGRFEVPGVVGAEQSLYVDAPGYVPTGPAVHTQGSAPLVIRLERAARIEGRVVDRAGQPVAEVSVRAFGEQTAGAFAGSDSLGVTVGPVPPISALGDSGLAFVSQTTTGADGRFVLGDLRPGPYMVAANHDSLAPAVSERFVVDGAETRSGVQIVMLPGAELAGRVVDERGFGLESIPIELRARDEGLPRMAVTQDDGAFSFKGVRGEVTVTALPYDLPPARETVTIEDDSRVVVELSLSTSLSTLRGRVVDPRGFGIGGALLTVTSEDPQTPARRSAKSDSDGTFTVPALPKPPYSVSVEHPAFSPTRLSEVEQMDDLRVVMVSGVTLIGEVLDDWSGDELPGVRVRLKGQSRAETQTRKDGTFVVRQLPTGTYDVSLAHPDYETQTRRVVLEPPRYVDRPQELETVRLEPGGVIEGAVVDVNREPAAGAEVAWGDPPRWERSARTDAAGSFRLRGVPSGVHWITARHSLAGEDSTLQPVQVRPLETSPGAFVRLPGSVTE
jgi:hypothetical protein